MKGLVIYESSDILGLITTVIIDGVGLPGGDPFETVEAESKGCEAINFICSRTFDLIVLTVGYLDDSTEGIEVLRQIKQHPLSRNAETPLVVLLPISQTGRLREAHEIINSHEPAVGDFVFMSSDGWAVKLIETAINELQKEEARREIHERSGGDSIEK